MPHTADTRYAVVSCHVEHPLDDAVWLRFATLQASRPGGFRVAALLRPPDVRAREDTGRWLERARVAAAHGPLGHHTHFVGPRHARPHDHGPEHAELVRREALWLRGQGVDARLFTGGAWYIDEWIAEALVELGYADCTATSRRPPYLLPGAPRLSAAEPTWLELASGRSLLELPTTHSPRQLLSGLYSLPRYVHLYFHDSDLLSAKRRLALDAALAVLGRLAARGDLEQLALDPGAAPAVPFSEAASRP